jgi:hypothetical protein
VNFERSWDLLESVQGHIRAFDVKAQVAIGVNGVLIGFLISEFTKTAELAALGFKWRLAGVFVATGLSILCSLAAIVLGVRVVHPQLRMNQPRSRMFFCHIAEEFGKNFVRAGESLAALSDEESLKDVQNQIAVNAYVCNIKAKRCKPTLALTALAFCFYAISILPFGSMVVAASRAASQSLTVKSALQSQQLPINPALIPSPTTSSPYAIPLATVIGALIALGGVGITLWGSRRNAKEQNGLSSRMKLADFRESWLNNLRDTTSELASVLLSIEDVSSAAGMQRAFELATKTKLLMNKTDVRYSELISLLEAIVNNDNTASRFKLAADLGNVVQDILKVEWGVLKRDLEYQVPKVRE